VHPYRDPPPLSTDPQERAAEPRVCVVTLLVLAGLRVLVAIRQGAPLDREATLALMLFVGAAWWSLRRAWRSARRWWRTRMGSTNSGWTS